RGRSSHDHPCLLPLVQRNLRCGPSCLPRLWPQSHASDQGMRLQRVPNDALQRSHVRHGPQPPAERGGGAVNTLLSVENRVKLTSRHIRASEELQPGGEETVVRCEDASPPFDCVIVQRSRVFNGKVRARCVSEDYPKFGKEPHWFDFARLTVSESVARE